MVSTRLAPAVDQQVGDQPAMEIRGAFFLSERAYA